jgi:hypothetical protein
MQNVDKKLREAHFFLEKMRERAAMAFGEHEEFDFHLSAFLNAGRSLDWRLRHTSKPYPDFRAAWDQSLSADETDLIKFMVDDRNLEVHEAGSTRQQEELRIPVRGTYNDASGTLTVFPGVPGTPPAEIVKPAYFFLISGRQVPVLEACDAYLRLLGRLVSDYRCAQQIV